MLRCFGDVEDLWACSAKSDSVSLAGGTGLETLTVLSDT